MRKTFRGDSSSSSALSGADIGSYGFLSFSVIRGFHECVIAYCVVCCPGVQQMRIQENSRRLREISGPRLLNSRKFVERPS